MTILYSNTPFTMYRILTVLMLDFLLCLIGNWLSAIWTPKWTSLVNYTIFVSTCSINGGFHFPKESTGSVHLSLLWNQNKAEDSSHSLWQVCAPAHSIYPTRAAAWAVLLLVPFPTMRLILATQYFKQEYRQTLSAISPFSLSLINILNRK